MAEFNRENLLIALKALELNIEEHKDSIGKARAIGYNDALKNIKYIATVVLND